MASFNLGYIKGERGPKGDKGDKGDIGLTGAKGTDGITPVFKVGNVETVDSGDFANVEIDTQDPANPVLNFYIPRGEHGRDASGDMLSSIYDTEGKCVDIYKFAESLFEKAVKKSGGVMEGILTAYEGNPEERCVRNIIFANELPSVASSGDICFIRTKNSGKALSEQSIGSTLLLTEGNSKAEYIVAATDYHGEGTVTLVRKYLLDNTMCFDYATRNKYHLSEVDVFLETVFVRLFSENVEKSLYPAEIATSLYRHCFLPSVNEIERMQYFKDEGAKATTKSGETVSYYLTRDLSDRKSTYAVSSSGSISTVSQTSVVHIRPIIVLPGSITVENTIYNKTAVAELTKENGGIYLYENGAWKELEF